MGELKFFKEFKQTFEALENQARSLVSAEDLVQLRQICAQIHAELEKYQESINNSLDLLRNKRNKYNQLLADSINSPLLNPEQYKQIDKQFKQLDCDIKVLCDFIKQVNSEVTIVHYEERLSSINEQISALEQSA